jgi:hypothetical protein
VHDDRAGDVGEIHDAEGEEHLLDHANVAARHHGRDEDRGERNQDEFREHRDVRFRIGAADAIPATSETVLPRSPSTNSSNTQKVTVTPKVLADQIGVALARDRAHARAHLLGI